MELFSHPNGKEVTQVKKWLLKLQTMLFLLGYNRQRGLREAMDDPGMLATRKGSSQMGGPLQLSLQGRTPKIRALILFLLTLTPLAHAAEGVSVEMVGTNVQVLRGAVNGALIERKGKTLAIYGDPREKPVPADTVLFTHHRRDVVWAGRALVAAGAKAVVPAGELADFTEVNAFWSEFARKRFHDYTHKSTKVLGKPITLAKTVRGGDAVDWDGLSIRVLDTPGYTRGAVSYLMDLDGQRIAFTGDLIYGDGKILDLYSLQDAITEAKMMAYHGYAARLADVINSLDHLAAEHPTLIIPSRGPVIRNPAEAIATLIARARAFYANYLSIDAYHYYSGDERFQVKARRILGQVSKVDYMPSAETVTPLPSWIVPIDNARLIIAADKTGFLVDCGSQHIIDEVNRLRTTGRLTSIEHIFVTHYHDDHTDQVSKAAKFFHATVHASDEIRDILLNPGDYRLPCLTTEPIQITGNSKTGSRWRWKEFELTLYYFPGQTLHHDALVVRKDSGEQFFFVGDSFTPSGIDDYCMLNRNFLHQNMGYFFCLNLIKKSGTDAFLINQHVRPTFRFSRQQLDNMRDVLGQRIGLLQALLPWDDPNFGLDEGWARFRPYAPKVRPGQTARLSLRIRNHSPTNQTFTITPHLPEGWALSSSSPIRPPRKWHSLCLKTPGQEFNS